MRWAGRWRGVYELNVDNRPKIYCQPLEISSLPHHNKILIWHFLLSVFGGPRTKNRKFKRALMVNPKKPSEKILMQKYFYYIMFMTIKANCMCTRMSWPADFFMYVWHWKLKKKLPLNIKSVVWMNHAFIFVYSMWICLFNPRHKHYHAKLFKFELKFFVCSVFCVKKNCHYYHTKLSS